MYYFQDSQCRERNVTRDVFELHRPRLLQALDLPTHSHWLREVPKESYGAKGDVDLLIFSDPSLPSESLTACEIKVIYLHPDGKMSSSKGKKSTRQLEKLEKDGFDYVWLLEFVVTEPASTWLHPQAANGIPTSLPQEMKPNYGYARFQLSGVNGKPESAAGSIGWRVYQKAAHLPHSAKRNALSTRIEKYSANQRGA